MCQELWWKPTLRQRPCVFDLVGQMEEYTVIGFSCGLETVPMLRVLLGCMKECGAEDAT